MNDNEYHELPGIRRSDLWKMSITPMHFRYAVDHPEEPTPSLIFGQAAHKYILEPESFFDEFEVIPKVDRRTKAGKQVMEAFEQLHNTKTLITAADMQTILAMREALMQNRDAKDIYEAATDKERAFNWTDPETGTVCKVKVDMLADLNGQPVIVDYKTTTSCADFAFERSCRKYGYDFQAGMYTIGVETEMMDRYEFIFIAQEKDPPYASRVYYCDPGFVDRGRRIYRDLLDEYAACKEADNWPGYESTDLYEEG